MTDLYEVALEVYARTAALFALRAGVELNVPPGKVDLQLIERAEALALGSATSPREAKGALVPALQSIAAQVRLPKEKNGAAQAMPQATSRQARVPYYYYTPQVIAGSAAIPKSQRPAGLQETYRDLWKQFEPEWRALMQDTAMTAQVRAESAHALLHRYTWAMAAPGEGGSDVSLFDYARVSAALAVCMAGQSETAPDPVALLVGGDLSGVQEWLYTLGSEGAAKSLRGRSVYLQLLSEIVALYILDALKLPPCNLLYAGGGNFYLLVPPDMHDAVMGKDEGQDQAAAAEPLQARISRKLLAMHGGALYVALGTAGLTEDLLRSNVGQTWGEVNRVMGRRKSRRFSELTNEEMAQAIGSGLEGTGILDDSCRVCRRTIGKGEDTRPVDDVEGGHVCGLCHSFEELGNLLPTVEFLAVTRVEESDSVQVTDWQEGLRTFGYDVQFLAPAGKIPPGKPGWQNPGGNLVRVYYWQGAPEPTEFPGWPGDARTVWTFRPLAQCPPLQPDGRVATFDELKSEGVDRWGVLRMDVDHLGAIFRSGIPATNLSRVVGLSSLLRLFFEGYLPLKMRERYNVTPDGKSVPAVYLMYSGGDDLFIVGGWSHLPGLAWDIRKWLADFAGQNPDVTISGGITLALDDKYPLYQAARDADKAEHQAKDAGRNALAFLGQAVKWDNEERTSFRAARKRVEQVCGWLAIDPSFDDEHEDRKKPPKQPRVPRGFLTTLRAIDAEWRRWKEHESGSTPRYSHSDRRLYLGPWQWHLIYTLRRAGQRSADSQREREIDQFVYDITAGEIEVLGLVTRWVELWTREIQ